jgi:hypothetical protein
MENVRKYIQDEFDRADSAYWDLYHKLQVEEKKLNQLQSEVQWIKIDMETRDNERKHFTKLLNELNEQT